MVNYYFSNNYNNQDNDKIIYDNLYLADMRNMFNKTVEGYTEFNSIYFQIYALEKINNFIYDNRQWQCSKSGNIAEDISGMNIHYLHSNAKKYSLLHLIMKIMNILRISHAETIRDFRYFLSIDQINYILMNFTDSIFLNKFKTTIIDAYSVILDKIKEVLKNDIQDPYVQKKTIRSEDILKFWDFDFRFRNDIDHVATKNRYIEKVLRGILKNMKNTIDATEQDDILYILKYIKRIVESEKWVKGSEYILPAKYSEPLDYMLKQLRYSESDSDSHLSNEKFTILNDKYIKDTKEFHMHAISVEYCSLPMSAIISIKYLLNYNTSSNIKSMKLKHLLFIILNIITAHAWKSHFRILKERRYPKELWKDALNIVYNELQKFNDHPNIMKSDIIQLLDNILTTFESDYEKMNQYNRSNITLTS